MTTLRAIWPTAIGTRSVNAPDQLALTAALQPGGDGLTAVYQPVIDLRDGRAIGYEGLVRGRQGGRTVVPAVLFAAARASGRLAELDRAALTTVVREAAPWLGGRPLFVHLLPRTLDAERVHELVRACRLLGLLPEDLVLEVPAHEPCSDAELRDVLGAAREHGARIALDDARPDRRTLAQLDLCQPEVVKVSMTLTHQLPAAQDGLARLQAAARDHGSHVVVEGVETAEQERVVGALGVTLVQGYRYGRPSPPHELAAGDHRLRLTVGGPA